MKALKCNWIPVAINYYPSLGIFDYLSRRHMHWIGNYATASAFCPRSVVGFIDGWHENKRKKCVLEFFFWDTKYSRRVSHLIKSLLKQIWKYSHPKIKKSCRVSSGWRIFTDGSSKLSRRNSPLFSNCGVVTRHSRGNLIHQQAFEKLKHDLVSEPVIKMTSVRN